jgi:hypothetical protein
MQASEQTFYVLFNWHTNVFGNKHHKKG